MEKIFQKISSYRALFYAFLAVIGTVNAMLSPDNTCFYLWAVFVFCQLFLIGSDCLKRAK